MPLLWVLPLGLYLLSFSVAFAVDRRLADILKRVAPFAILMAGCSAFMDSTRFPFSFAALILLNLFVVSVALHSEMFARRPHPEHLTRFYLAMSLGGVLGGLFCAMIAPLVFNWTYEHPILIVAASLLLASSPIFEIGNRLWGGSGSSGAMISIAAGVLIFPHPVRIHGAVAWHVLHGCNTARAEPERISVFCFVEFDPREEFCGKFQRAVFLDSFHRIPKEAALNRSKFVLGDADDFVVSLVFSQASLEWLHRFADEQTQGVLQRLLRRPASRHFFFSSRSESFLAASRSFLDIPGLRPPGSNPGSGSRSEAFMAYFLFNSNGGGELTNRPQISI